MRIYIMRHGEAENFAPSDAERPLTVRGLSQSREIAVMLASQLADPIDLVWVSPYLRAQQTWQAMADELPDAKDVVTTEEITPYGNSERVIEYLKAVINIQRPKSILLVSHLPLVGYLTVDLVSGDQAPMFPTSALAAIDYDPDTERAELLWLEAPENIKRTRD